VKICRRPYKNFEGLYPPPAIYRKSRLGKGLSKEICFLWANIYNKALTQPKSFYFSARIKTPECFLRFIYNRMRRKRGGYLPQRMMNNFVAGAGKIRFQF
jgi:hypothetical protein